MKKSKNMKNSRPISQILYTDVSVLLSFIYAIYPFRPILLLLPISAKRAALLHSTHRVSEYLNIHDLATSKADSSYVTITTGRLLPHLLTLANQSFSEDQLASTSISGHSLLRYCTLTDTFYFKSTLPCVVRTFLPVSNYNRNQNDKTACCISLLIFNYFRYTKVAPYPYSLKEASWYFKSEYFRSSFFFNSCLRVPLPTP